MSNQSYLDILLASRQEIAIERATRPRSCPNDGEPLRAGPDDILFCTYDGYQWPRDREAGMPALIS